MKEPRIPWALRRSSMNHRLGRRDLLAFAIAGVGRSLVSRGAAAGGLRRIGFLTSGSKSAVQPAFEGFRRRTGELGYAEGTDIVYELRFADTHFDRLPDLVRELIALSPAPQKPKC